MDNVFDSVAKNYDQVFTHSKIGRLQRQLVRDHLEKLNINKERLNILEVNCGTGEDALWFAKQNHHVTATDISAEMIHYANKKKKFGNIKFQQLDINALSTFSFPNKFDLIFSNFGGLNCLNPEELTRFFVMAKTLLNKNGTVVCVIMPKQCIWDKYYYFLKGKWTLISRRNTEHCVLVNVSGNPVKTWFYNPNEIVSLTVDEFKKANYYPIGICVPPSYLNTFFKNKTRLLNFLNWSEHRIGRFRFLSKYADHFILSLQVS
ncbi:class I SAM-dependent DNA methyltransferase [Flavobacteriaceae bacterium LMO-SS05]